MTNNNIYIYYIAWFHIIFTSSNNLFSYCLITCMAVFRSKNSNNNGKERKKGRLKRDKGTKMFPSCFPLKNKQTKKKTKKTTLLACFYLNYVASFSLFSSSSFSVFPVFFSILNWRTLSDEKDEFHSFIIILTEEQKTEKIS